MKTKNCTGAFTGGLVVGLFAGVITQFLQTEAGQQVKQQLAKQWQEARNELLASGLIDELIPEEAEDVLKYIWKEVALNLSQLKKSVNLESQKPVKRKRLPRAKTKQTKFKGV